MRRTVVVKVNVKDEDEYADVIEKLAAAPGVESWRASSMSGHLMRRLRASGLQARWLPGALADAVR